MTTFKYQHISKAPSVDVYNAHTDTSGAAGIEDSTVEALDAEHVYANVANGNVAAPTHLLCHSIAHNNAHVTHQLKYLLEHLSEPYE